MDFIEMETFLEVADSLNISKAAQRMYVSQSTITNRLQRLEKELQYSLFLRYRGKRTMELTARGEEFISIANRWMKLYQEMELLKISTSQSLTIASIDSVILTILPEPLRQTARIENRINIKIQTEHTANIYQFVRNREADIGFTSTDAAIPEVITKPMFRQRFVLIKPCKHPEKPKQIHPQELDSAYEIFLPWGHDYMKWHEYWWQTGFSHIKVDSVMTLTHFLDNENLWAILPVSCVNTVLKSCSIQVYEFIEGPPDWICYKVRHKHPRKQNLRSIQKFEEILENFSKETTLFQ